MTAEWAEPDEQAWRLYGGLHRLLLRLAGQIPDELLSHTRTLLGTGEFAYLPDTVTASAAELGVSLTAAETRLLREVLATLGDDQAPTGTDQVTISEATPATDHRFIPVPPQLMDRVISDTLDLTAGPPPGLADLADDLTDLSDDLVVDALTEHDGVTAIWRAWRSGTGGWRRVYLAEVEPGVRAWDLTVEAQEELTHMDDGAPQVEVYWVGEDLPPYHHAARAHAALLWKRA